MSVNKKTMPTDICKFRVFRKERFINRCCLNIRAVNYQLNCNNYQRELQLTNVNS